MNIAIFTDYYLPSFGGTQTAIFQQKKALESRGHKVTIVTVNYPEWRGREDFILLPSPVNLRIGANIHSAYIPFPSSDKWLAAKLQKRSIDIIHVESDFSVGAMGFRMAKKLKLPCVYTIHTMLWKQADLAGPGVLGMFSIAAVRIGLASYLPGRQNFSVRSDESLFYQTFRDHIRNLANGATIVISPSDHLSKKLIRWGVKTPIVIQPNFRDTAPVRKPLPKKPIFLWAGRFDPEKRPLDFCDALNILEQIVGEDAFGVIMVGSGEFLDQIRLRIGDKPWLIHLGMVSNEDMPSIIDRSSVLVMTSQDFDNQPMVIAESITHGRGVIAVDRNLKEGLMGGAGIWTDSNDVQGLASTMQAVVQDTNILETMSEAAWRNKRIFTSEYGVRSLEGIYKKATSLHARL